MYEKISGVDLYSYITRTGQVQKGLEILVDDEGNSRVIDFMNLCRGPKLYDIARSYYLMRGDGPVNPDIVPLLQAYLKCHGVEESDLESYFEVISICHKWEML